MKKILALATALSLSACLLSGCSGNDASSAGSAGGSNQSSGSSSGGSEFTEKYTWSLSSTYSSNSPMMEGAQVFADKLAEYSDGAITLNVFADSALMGENDAFAAIKADELEFACFGPTPIYLYSPEVGYYLAPFLLQSWDEVKTVYYSEPLEKAKETWRNEYNTRDIGGMVQRGWRNMSCSTPVNSVSDLKGVKLRLNDNQMWADIWNTLGATTVTINLGELYTSLQNGAVTASEGPWEQMATYSLWEVQDYVIQTQHVMESVGFWMSENLYQSLPDNYKDVIDRAAADGLAYIEEQCAARDSEYLQQMQDGGSTFIEPDRESFLKAAEPIYEEYFETTWTATTMEELNALLGR